MRIRMLGRRAALTLVGAVGWMGCSDWEPLTGPSGDLQLRTQGPRPEVAVAIAAQERHTAALLAVPGVVGTAVGVLPDGRIGVRIFVEDASVRNLPPTIDGVPAAVQVTGRFMALSDPTTRQRPAPMGFSIGHPAITAGSIGALVRDGSGNGYVLSNNHVLANSNNASIGDPEYQPGPFDGGTAADQIGTLAAFNSIVFTSTASNTIDAAIALTNDVANHTPLDDGYGPPSSKIYGDANNDGSFDDVGALLGLPVQKYGRTTKLTRGQITGVNATVVVCYEVQIIFCVKSARFVNQLTIGPGGFSGGGDSGSLIVSDDANKNPVGLLFAGSSTMTIANRIDLVLNHFGVTVDGSTPPSAPVTDVAVINVGAPGSVAVGSTVDVVVTVRNVGNQDIPSGFGVGLVDMTDGVVIGAQPVWGLAAGATATLTFSWNTTGRSLGSHTLSAFHGLPDDVGGNNLASATVAVDVPVTDVAVISVGAPGSVAAGSTVSVVVTVRNVGNQDVSSGFGVGLVDQTDGIVIGAQPVWGLAVGATATLTFSWNTTGHSLGSHTLSAFHGLPDDVGGNNLASATVAVTALALHVGDLDALASGSGTSWSASVDITVHDANHQPLNGVTLRGAWSPAGLASDECATGDLGGNGTCFVLFPFISSSQAFVTFTVTSATLAGWQYQPGANHDPDGGSNGTTITVNRPF